MELLGVVHFTKIYACRSLAHGGVQQTLIFAQCSAANIGTCCKLVAHQLINLHAMAAVEKSTGHSYINLVQIMDDVSTVSS